MKQRDIPQGENMTDEALEQWAQAFGYVATRYRVACSPGSLIAGAPWLKGKPMVPALTQLARDGRSARHQQLASAGGGRAERR